VNLLATPCEEANMERKLFVFSCIAFLILIDVSVQARNLEDKIVFVSERRGIPEVFLVEGLDGRPFQLTRNLFASSPSISPDGTEVVFVSDPPAHAANILKLNIAKRRIEQLTHNAKQDIRYKSLDWSPDGQKILFIMVTDTPEDSKMDLCVMDIKERHIRHILQPDPPTWISHPSWAPDSNHILYHQDTRDSSGIFIIDDNGNNVINISQDPFAFLPAWSPKRNQIGYIDLVVTIHLPQNPLQIYMMDLTKASVTALTSGGDEERIPLAWHPDGQKILFVTLSLVGPGPEWSDIFVMDNNGENIINLTQTPEMEVWASWSPDGGQIVFDREVGEDEGAIFIMEADGQNPQRLTFEPGRNYAPSWSPDGNKIAFLSYRNGATRIYTMDTNGQNVQQVTHHGREFDGPPAWSPDGRWLAFVSGDDEGWGLYITDPQGHNENLIVRSNPIPLSMLAWNRPAWSPDSQHLIYVVEEQNSEGLMKIRIDGNMPTQLKTDELVNWLSPVWAPGGNNLLFSAREAREPLVLVEYRMLLMNLDTSQKHAFVLPGLAQKNWGVLRLVWGPDGSQLILSVMEGSHQTSLYLIDIANETMTLWMEDAKEADWVRPGFVYAVAAAGKRITTWAELKKPEVP
jgi:TolB protein